MYKKLFFLLVFLGMGVNGFLDLSLFLLSSNSDRAVHWFFMYLLVFPYLGFLGIAGLVLKDVLGIPLKISVVILLYVGILTILANSFHLGWSWMLGWLPYLNYEFLHLVLFTLTLLCLIVLVQRRY